ncbi:hypothetical protein PIB30_077109 [Stylosanthes scabra]|uniref:Uncharacterized protein n=1 Tax=Stylosanthes scabra TaxID=79078 RepID=A0ABU6SQL8_9FABA|nr:hypothetical protein [Stylosanthes scabra]
MVYTLGPGVHRTGHYSSVESNAKEDAAFAMIQKVFPATSQFIRDFHFLHAKSLQRANDHLTAEIERLEEKIKVHGYDSTFDDVTPRDIIDNCFPAVEDVFS